MRQPKPWFRASKNAWFVELGGKQIRLAKGRESEREAYDAFYRLMSARPEHLPPPDKITVARLCDLFLEQSQRHHAPDTYALYRHFLQSFCDAHGRLPAATVKPFHLSRWLDANPSWDAARRHAVMAVKRAFSFADQQGVLTPNPVRHVAQDPVRRRTRVLTKDEQAEILAAIKDEPFRQFVLAMIETGCRPSEVARVTAADVNLDLGVWVFHAHKTAKKTGKPRVVYLTPAALALTRELVAKHPDGPLFRGPRGGRAFTATVFHRPTPAKPRVTHRRNRLFPTRQECGTLIYCLPAGSPEATAASGLPSPPRQDLPMLPTAAAFVLLLAPAAEPAAKPVEFFENRIRPVLVEQCYQCHSAEAKGKKKLKGGLMLDTKEAVLKGGDSGPAVVPGKPAESLLLKSLQCDGDIKMPPAGKLGDPVLKDFETWIAAGAADPRTDPAVKAGAIDIETGKKFWSFQPVREPEVPAASASKNPVDAFVAAKWKEQKLTPVGAADKRALLRRVYLDLIGLPPTVEDVEAFEKDASADAFAKIVDKLLASPQHGEKWARHWLDVARYAEDQAHTFGVQPKTQAWRYRDWVIKALNDDMPYDRFVKMQLAADMLPDAPADPFEKFAGLGFLGLGAEYYRDAGCGPRADADELDDKLDTLTRGFLGLTVACARCHDHKFDPIPTKDYYALGGVYVGTKLSNASLHTPEEQKAFNDAQAKVKEAEGKANKAKDEQKKLEKEKKDDNGAIKAAADKAKELAAEVDKLKQALPPAPVVHVLSGNGPGMRIMVRGNPTVFGEEVPKGFLQVLPSATKPGKEFNRLSLAEAIASKDNPLTARVIVNRVWAWHYGRGIVGSPSNFGVLGDAPTNQPLLDWLAANFVKNGWSLKWLHRQIVLSTAYQLDSRPDEANDKIDAGNVYLWRANRRRLDVEQWRDSLLSVSGTLDTRLGGPAFSLRDASVTRRTVYAKVSRHELDGLLRLFDFPDANVTADKRVVTTVPQQQLFALNSPFMTSQARAFAARAEKLGKTDAEKVAAAYRLAFGRAPETQELDLAERFLKLPANKDDRLTRWQQFAQVLLASNELMFMD